jgi:hypothetical protein
MILKKLVVIILILLTTIANTTKARGVDFTPEEIQKTYYIWNKKIEEPNSKSKNNEDIWFSEYTSPIDGYINLLTGEKLIGKIIVHHKWNRASEKKLKETTVNKDGSKQVRYYKDPLGIDIIEDVKITTNGVEKIISTNDIAHYGAHFKVLDWASVKKQKIASDSFNKGTLTYLDGTKKEGLITLRSSKYLKKRLDIRYFNCVYFAQDENAIVEAIETKNLQQAIQSASGVDVLYTNFNNHLIHRDLLIESLQTSAKKVGYHELSDGKIFINDGEEVAGQLCFKKGMDAVLKTHVIFIDNEKNVRFLRCTDDDIIYIENKGVTYYPLETKFASEKELGLKKGYIQFKDESKVEGEMSYRKNYILFKGADNKIKNYTAKKGDIDFAIQDNGSSKTKYSLVNDTKNGNYFIQLYYPFQKYSYYKNPNPTNINSGASLAATLTATAAAAMDEGENELDELADQPLDFYYTEYVIIINKTGEEVVVYKKNIDEQKARLLGSCSRMSVDNRKKIQGIEKVKEIEDLVTTLNTCADQD